MPGISTAAALAISAGISAASGAGQGISAARANKRGVAFGREQMKWQEQQTDKARAWQEKMWDKQNQYDSALQQRQRLQAAGLNPYLMMDGGSAGSGSSVPSTDTPSGVGNMSFQPTIDGSNGLLSAGQTMSRLALDKAQVAKDNAVTDGQNISNTFAPLLLNSQIGLNTSQRDKNVLERYGQELLNQWSESTMQYRIEREKLLNELNVQQTAGLSIQNAISQFNLDHLPESWQKEMEEKTANIYQMYQAGLLSEASAKNQLAQAALAEAQKVGVEISNKVASETANSLIGSMIAQNYSNYGYYNTDPNGGETNLYPDWNGNYKTFDKLSPTRRSYVNGQYRGIRDHQKQYNFSKGYNIKIGSDYFGNVGWGQNSSGTHYK